MPYNIKKCNFFGPLVTSTTLTWAITPSQSFSSPSSTPSSPRRVKVLDCVPIEYNFTSFMMFNYCVKAPHLVLKLSEALQTQEERNSFLIYICTHSSIGQWPSCVLNPQFSFSLVIILAWSTSSSSGKTNLSFISSLDVNLLSATIQTSVIKIHHKECNSTPLPFEKPYTSYPQNFQ